jgi:hypothetical protein
MLQVRRLLYRLAGFGSWAYYGPNSPMKRYNFATDRWEAREMTTEEAEEAHALWAIK